MKQFLEWSKKRGIAANAAVEKTTYAGYGLFATQDKPSNPIVHIPASTLLSSRKALEVQPFAETLTKLYETTDLDAIAELHEKQTLCLFLIYCSFFDLTTEWKPYMDILPAIDFFKQYHPPFNLYLVQGTCLENSVRAKINTLRRELDTIKQCNDHWLSSISIDMYQWADCVFWSRVVGIGGAADSETKANMVLIPFFDFANHSVDKPNIRWQPAADGGIDLVSECADTINKGDELLLSYGPKPNQELLFLHGFCVPDNPVSSCVTLPISPFLDPNADPLNTPKIYWLKHVGAKPTLTLSRPNTEGTACTSLLDCGWSRESLQTMYFVVLNEDDGLDFSHSTEEEIKLQLQEGQDVLTLGEIEDVVSKMEMLPVIQLRVALLLLDALEYQYSLITEHASVDETSIGQQVAIYRNEEKTTVEAGMEALSELRDLLMTNDVVVAYLKNTQ